MNTSFLLAILFAIALGPQLLALEVSVEADKLRVKPGDPVNLDVLVKGLPAGQTADVVCRITSGVDTEEANLTGKTDAAGMARFSFVPKKEFGYGATATARADAESATASEVFASATNAYTVAVDYSVPEVYGQDVLPDGSAAPEGPVQKAELKTRIAAAIAHFRDLYLTVGELMGPAFCSFSSIKPPVPNYFKGFHYNYSANAIRELISGMHSNGISSVIYVNASFSGLAGTDFARRHPEYVAFSPDGMPFNGGVNISTLVTAA